MTALLFILLVVALPAAGILGFLYKKGLVELQEKEVQRVREVSELQSKIQEWQSFHASEIQRVSGDMLRAYQSRIKELEDEASLFRAHYEKESRRITEEANHAILEMSQELEGLKKYSGLKDAEAEIASFCEQVLLEAHRLKADAELVLQTAQTQAQGETVIAQKKAEDLYGQADALLRQATKDAALLIANAEKQAQQIAGEAYDALRDRQTIESAVKAIHNVIEGYGDRYVTPMRSMIDDLAEGFSHTAAGQSFKMARARAEQMVLEGLAAACDYSDEQRRATAIRFVIDAFNGKVDSIFSQAKHDNFGTLAQKVKDAFALVNLNGEAFRYARILPEYLESRLAELQWATMLHELKRKEREEQRAIQEQMREEEKVRREQERLAKESAREEAIAREAYEKAKLAAENANTEEKARLQAQLEEISQKLAEAELKSQRVKSLAEQTKAGHVYVISNIGSFGNDVFKIGMTRRQDPMDRVWELGDASVPFDFDVHAIISTKDAPALEGMLHKQFASYRINQINFRKEFFRVPLHEVRRIVESQGLEVQWTMVAEAHEYNETLALLKSAQPVLLKTTD